MPSGTSQSDFPGGGEPSEGSPFGRPTSQHVPRQNNNGPFQNGGHSGANGGETKPSFGPGGSGPGGVSTGSQDGPNPHGAPGLGSEGPISGTSHSGFPSGGSPEGPSQHVPRQNNEPFQNGGHSGANGGEPNPSFGLGGSGPGGASAGSQNSNPHGAPGLGSEGPISGTSHSGFPSGGSPEGPSQHIPRQNNNGPFQNGGHSGTNGGEPSPSFGSGGSGPGGAPGTGSQNGEPHGAPLGSEGPGPISSTSESGFPAGGLPEGHPSSQHVPRQNSERPFPSSGSGQSSNITTANNSTFLPYTIAYYTPPFDVRGLSTVMNGTQGELLVEFITENGGERDGDWWKVPTADFVYHIESYTTTIGGAVYNLTAVSA
ncbi:hypothetical protein BJ912DRAFT_945013 [Pholiota molesta]|nr:hypothetical protein BJ912DRAFT_945013 [Pholiota molesta]